jgi:hypothetical protein
MALKPAAKTCDKCPGEVRAAVTDKLMFNGSRYDIDRCEKHSLERCSAMMLWCDIGTKVGESAFDQQVIAREVTHSPSTHGEISAGSTRAAPRRKKLPQHPLHLLPRSARRARDPKMPPAARQRSCPGSRREPGAAHASEGR